jgi:hypothetical protein
MKRGSNEENDGESGEHATRPQMCIQGPYQHAQIKTETKGKSG